MKRRATEFCYGTMAMRKYASRKVSWEIDNDQSGTTTVYFLDGTHKNMNVMDGFASVQYQKKQYNTRVSRTLRPGIDISSVGPLHVDIIEPFKKLRLRLDSGEHPASYDLTWTAVLPPYVEARSTNYFSGRITQDSTRYDQLGSVNGWITLEGNKYEIEKWWGARDHSWGVRPGVGGFEPSVGVRPDPFLWLWAYFSIDEFGCMFQPGYSWM